MEIGVRLVSPEFLFHVELPAESIRLKLIKGNKSEVISTHRL